MGATVSAPVEWIEFVSDLRLPPRENERLQQLMDRNTEGLLTESELAELETLVELSALFQKYCHGFRARFVATMRGHVMSAEITFVKGCLPCAAPSRATALNFQRRS
jgi:hypothetical protein